VNQYPLEQVIHIKKKRFDEAVKVLEAKKEILEKAYETLFDLTEEFTQADNHKKAKLEQIRQELDSGTTSEKILQMKAYFKNVEEEVKEKKKKVDDQQIIVNNAQEQVDIATDDLFQKKKDLEKLELHKKEWQKEENYKIQKKDQSEQDEQGSTSFNRLKREQKLREKKDRSEGNKS